MNYYELTFTCISPIETEVITDILAAELGECGFESFTQTPDGMVGYIAEKDYDKSAVDEQLANFLLPDVQITYTKQLVVGRDWNEEWEKNYFKPICIDNECIIRASFHPEEQGFTHTILIDPKMAFGTGNHATTWLMMRAILHLDLQGLSVLDMGCGTGVLAILAAKKGAGRIVAIDIDEWAYRNALENISLNNTSQIEVLLGGAELLHGMPPFDVVIANINRNILLNDITTYSLVMKPGSTLLMSGFYQSDIPNIEEECKRNGIRVCGFEVKDEWVALHTMKE